ncbi:hypothetical protein WJX73_008382 [Symbiochloris irregularis]|uniref:Uncharacterized protein n=1 Tax=Symbiochloris irregularis TaxID=706552 RepID=A0AAW1NI77_9CHLO
MPAYLLVLIEHLANLWRSPPGRDRPGGPPVQVHAKEVAEGKEKGREGHNRLRGASQAAFAAPPPDPNLQLATMLPPIPPSLHGQPELHARQLTMVPAISRSQWQQHMEEESQKAMQDAKELGVQVKPWRAPTQRNLWSQIKNFALLVQEKAAAARMASPTQMAKLLDNARTQEKKQMRVASNS